MSKTIYNLGVLGLGEGRSILSAAQTSKHWEVLQICDLNEALCQERQAEFLLSSYTTDYATMLADERIDVIAIYTPDPFHAIHIEQALEAGKHVICTKPLLDDLESGSRLYKLWKAKHRQVFVGQSSRFVESMRRQRADFEAGKHGELVSVEAHYHHDHRDYMRFKWGASMPEKINWVYLGLSHPTDLVRWYMPDIEEVFGYGMITPFGKDIKLVSPDAMHFVLKTKQGKIARVSGVYGIPDQNHQRDSLKTCTIRGSLGVSQSDYPELRYQTNFQGEGYHTHTFPELSDYYYRFKGYSHHAGEFQNYIDYLAECLNGGHIAQPDLANGLLTVAVMKAMEWSLERAQPVKVTEVLAHYELTDLENMTSAHLLT